MHSREPARTRPPGHHLLQPVRRAACCGSRPVRLMLLARNWRFCDISPRPCVRPWIYASLDTHRPGTCLLNRCCPLRAAGTGTIAGVWLNISISVIPNNTSLAHQARFFQLLTSSFWDAAIAWYASSSTCVSTCWALEHPCIAWLAHVATCHYSAHLPLCPLPDKHVVVNGPPRNGLALKTT